MPRRPRRAHRQHRSRFRMVLPVLLACNVLLIAYANLSSPSPSRSGVTANDVQAVAPSPTPTPSPSPSPTAAQLPELAAPSPSAAPSRSPSTKPPKPRRSTPAATATRQLAAATSPPAAPGTSAPPPAPPSPAPAPPPSPAPPSPHAAGAGLPHFSHVAVIVMENQEYGSIIGNSSAPYLNSLADKGALAANYDAVSHPSLPNYLALTGGSTFGVSSDCDPSSSCAGTTSVVQEMSAAGISWKAYMEDLPSPCAQSNGANYHVDHNPFVYYPDIVGGSCGNVVPSTQLGTDIAGGALPSFIWLTPSMCDDMHDCSVASGDSYLKGVVPQLLGALGPTGVLFVVWDEGTTNAGGGGHVAMIAAGPAVKAGSTSTTAYNHYSLLRTIEDGWGLPRLGESAGAPAMLDLFG